MKSFWSRFALVAAVGAFAASAGAVRADVISATGTGFNISTSLSLTLLSGLNVDASVGPTSFSSISAPPPYATNDSVASLNVSQGSVPLVGTLLGIQTGLLTSSADSTVDGSGLAGTTSAGATVDGLALDVLNLLLGPTVLSVTADAVSSTASVSGGYGSLVGSGGTTFANLSINLLGLNVATVDGTVAANTGIDVASILGGVSIILNEQISSGDGVGSLSYAVNAIHISFNNVGIAGVGTLNGDLVISHADVSQTAVPAAVPEPSSLALVALGGVGALLTARRARRS